MHETACDRIVAEIGQSRKYRDLCPATIRDVAAREFVRHKSPRDAAAAARRRLHRLWAEFLGSPNYDVCRANLDAAFAVGGNDAVEVVCRQILAAHASSRERLDDLKDFYRQLFGVTGLPERVLDLASAFQPFGFRWMGLPRSVRYHAYDINARIVSLTNHYFQLEGIAGGAEHRDVLCNPPDQPADLALLLKMYHCLERRRAGAGWQAVSGAPAQWVAVSFPTRNLTARRVDIAGRYAPGLRECAASRGWTVVSIGIESETVLVVRKG